jgi:hypothetical protein
MTDGSIVDAGGEFGGVEPSAALSKKTKQWKKWDEEIIPMLIEPYLRLLRETQSLHNLTTLQQNEASPACDGCSGGRSLRVSCVYFESMSFISGNEVLLPIFASEIVSLTICTCTPAALQLLSLGLFPCAPSRPSLAVDINMLEFVGELFTNAAPNTTAWCETLETFLATRRYKLMTRVRNLSFNVLCALSIHLGLSSTPVC